MPGDIAHFLDAKKEAQPADVRGDVNDDDDVSSDDVPLLQMEDVNDHEGGWPIYLGMLNRKDFNPISLRGLSVVL